MSHSQTDLQFALTHQRAGRFGDAEESYKRILERDPTNAEAIHFLGMAIHQLGRSEEALPLLHRAVELQPATPRFRSNLAALLGALGRHGEALPHLETATRLRPDYPEGWFNLGVALEYHDRRGKALSAFERAIFLRPSYANAYTRRGSILWKLGQTAEAIKCHLYAIELDPNLLTAHRNLATVLMGQGKLAELTICCRKIIELAPNSASDHSGLLPLLHYDAHNSMQEIFDAAREWANRHAAPSKIVPYDFPNNRSAGRRLRIGYVTADFRNHPIGRIVQPLVEHRDSEAFELFCYSDVKKPDSLTEALRVCADHWRDVCGILDARVMEIIRSDQIDILVDLTGHLANNRLTLFGLRPAPVQATCIGYANTTGIQAVDYRISDIASDPPGREKFHSEKLIHLPDRAWCYVPPATAHEVNPLPALQAGMITFCELNQPLKVTDEAIAVWAKILLRVPRSRLLLLAGIGASEYMAQRFARHGVTGHQLELIERLPRNQYFELYHRADIALDPFPFSGDTTTCDLLWMGVPLITLAGEAFFSRRGVSHLSNVGLSHLIAHSTEEYIERSVALASDLPTLAKLRSELRERMRRSPLTDAKRYARDMERVYRQVWTDWTRRHT